MALPQPPDRDENPGLGPLLFIVVAVGVLLLLVLLNLPAA